MNQLNAALRCAKKIWVKISLCKEGKAPRLNTSRFIHVFSPCSKNSLVPIFPLQSTRPVIFAVSYN